jgi:hypothetical protein
MPKQRKPIREKRTRVRSKRLDQLDESKLALALWLLAKQMVVTSDSDTQPNESSEETETP